MGMDNVVVLTSFVNEMDAQMVVLELQAAGIDAFIRKDDCGGMRPMITAERGIEVMVPKKDLARALEILELTQGEMLADSGSDNGSRRSISKIELIAVLVLGLIAGWFVHRAYMEQFVFQDTYEVDRNGDGRIDEIWDYDKEGVCIGGRLDDNFDGAWDCWFNYLDGQLISSESDTDFNGVIDAHSTYLNGVLVLREIRPNGAENPICRETYQHGVFWREVLDTDQDGVMDTEKIYDAFGKLERCQPVPVEGQEAE
jgi:hypothetical protein